MTLRYGITAVIPTIPVRAASHLHRALDSVLMQERAVDAISVASDHSHAGAAATRNRALSAVQTKWSAFLDDDDEWQPDHLRLLIQHANDTGADMVYPWFTVPNGFDPFPQFEGQEFDPEWLVDQNMIPVTVLVRTELIRSVGGFEAQPHDPQDPNSSPCDDWAAWVKLHDAGAKIVHLNRRTWLWHWHSGNTSGRGDKW